jgi:hypothetical protein
MVKYRIYPSLLDEFARFINGKISRENLLNRINRIRDFDEDTFQRMQRGIRFENAVLKGARHDFKPQSIDAVRSLLPKEYKTQYPTHFIHENVQVYGFADVVGERRVIDIKTTANFRPEKYQNSFQNLYLYALKNAGAESMEYIVYDFEKIHHLAYQVEEINFQPYLDNIILFREFLEEQRGQITDPKIFVKPQASQLF